MTAPRQSDETLAARHGRRLPVAAWINAFAGLASRLPLPWSRTRRRRRLLFLALCAPGFVATFATPLHNNFILLLLGIVLFGAAALFRATTEPLFERADAACRQTVSLTPTPSEGSHHA